MRYEFPKYTNLSTIDKMMVEAGYRKYGEDGVNLVKRYCVSSYDNENTQFFRYLYERGVKDETNYFVV